MRGKLNALQFGVLIAATALCLLGLILTGQAITTQLKYQGGVEAPGMVTDREVDDSLNGDVEHTAPAYRIQVRFTDRAGAEHTRWATHVASPDQYAPSDEVTVRYDPDDDDWLAVGESTAGGYWLSAGVLFAIAAMLVVFVWHKARLTRKRDDSTDNA